MDEMVTLIQSVGFPIACTIILAYLLFVENKQHKEEMNSLKDAIHSNTLIMTELKQLLIDIRGDEYGSHS